jgi:signal transduction histidine kinase
LHNQTGLLARLVEDLRTLSLADAGRLTLELRRLDLVELVRNVATAFGASLEAKKIKLELNLPTRPRQIRADADRMTQIAGNLLANALAHTPEGGVIAIAVFADDKTTTLRVSDTGPGIPPEALSKVFDRFYRSEASRSRATGGSGLGLSIVKALVELHGGTVAARNQPEGGAVFEVRLPLDQAGG